MTKFSFLLVFLIFGKQNPKNPRKDLFHIKIIKSKMRIRIYSFHFQLDLKLRYKFENQFFIFKKAHLLETGNYGPDSAQSRKNWCKTSLPVSSLCSHFRLPESTLRSVTFLKERPWQWFPVNFEIFWRTIFKKQI